MLLQSISQLNPLPTEWLWPGYLAAGKLAILDGSRPGKIAAHARSRCAPEPVAANGPICEELVSACKDFNREPPPLTPPQASSDGNLEQPKTSSSSPLASAAASTAESPLGQVGQLLVTWLGPSPLTADELTSRRSRPRCRVREFLRRQLASAPRPAKEIWAAARAQGFARSTILRAKADLTIRTERTYSQFGRRDYWLLPGQKAPLPPGADPEIVAWLDRLEAQYESSPIRGEDAPS